MTYQAELKQFSHKMHAEILDLGDFKENGFTTFVCQQMIDSGMIDNYEILYFEKKVKYEQMKINAYGMDEQRENLVVFVCHYTDMITPTKIQHSDIQPAAKALSSFIKHSLKDLPNHLKKNSEEYSVSKLISESKNKLLQIRLFILTDGLLNMNIVQTNKFSGIDVKVEILDLARLFDMSTLGNIESEIELDFEDSNQHKVECIGIQNQSQGIKSYLAVMPGDILYQLYEAYGSKLMELNVRSFLQVTGKINKGIRETLLEEPNMFFSYNNGIAVTAESIEFRYDDEGKRFIKKIKGFQIVNGGQTTASIHRAKKVDDVDVSKILVPTKITVVEKDMLRRIVPKISRYSNSQNAVKQSDFHSDNVYHRLIKELSQQTYIPGESGKWYYERMRGDYQNDKFKLENNSEQKKRFADQTPLSRKFTKEDIAKYINAWEQKPYFVCTGAQKNFIFFMDSHALNAVKDKIVDEKYLKDIVGQTILYRSVEKIVKEQKIPAFRAQIVPYVIAILSRNSASRFDFSLIWQDQKISNELHHMLFKWTETISQRLINSVPEARNPTEWFKKTDCWKKIRDMSISVKGTSVPRELKGSKVKATERQKQDIYSDEEMSNIRKCKKVTSNEWLKINKWGQLNGMLDQNDLGYTLTLSRMAGDRWKDTPSPAIASTAVAILELAYENDVI